MTIPCGRSCTDPLNLTIDYVDPDTGDHVWMSKCYYIEGELLEWDDGENAWTGPNGSTTCDGDTITIYRRLKYGSTTGFVLEWVSESLGVIAKWSNTLQNVVTPNCGVMLYSSFIAAACPFANYPCTQRLNASSTDEIGDGISGEINGWGEPACYDTFNCFDCTCSDRPWAVDLEVAWFNGTGCSPLTMYPDPTFTLTMSREPGGCIWTSPTKSIGRNSTGTPFFYSAFVEMEIENGGAGHPCSGFLYIWVRDSLSQVFSPARYASGPLSPDDFCGSVEMTRVTNFAYCGNPLSVGNFPPSIVVHQ